ncbi:MAG: hypothetical protein HXK34_00685 [Atopobium sp.]|nr:hypothetical protein [Atopobium sp.]
MWECINGEWIYMDKEMGADEYERQNAVSTYENYSPADVRDHGKRLSAGGVAVGVAGGMIAAKAAPRIGGWLLWMALFAALVMVFS